MYHSLNVLIVYPSINTPTRTMNTTITSINTPFNPYLFYCLNSLLSTTSTLYSYDPTTSTSTYLYSYYLYSSSTPTHHIPSTLNINTTD